MEQADGTAWMAMYSLNMLQIALEISMEDPTYEDMCTKFFKHFVYIASSPNRMGDDWQDSWDEEEGFFYDILVLPNDNYVPIKVRSLVGLMTLNAVLVLEKAKLSKLKGFTRGLKWFRNYREKNGLYQIGIGIRILKALSCSMNIFIAIMAAGYGLAIKRVGLAVWLK
ncbi:hypothetical protein SAMN05421636_105343 [Pricia antarctica]|uniref:Uncharacterized protein n=1 Tax=Pricia antarctica TaxID=641691 RepID=A0A1G7DII3_9FLAO|nr:hypothetical protein [Pricia antarctica]SDE51358.1 hypothetical protein SAMN05421636_105343 [Pricia antarctica]